MLHLTNEISPDKHTFLSFFKSIFQTVCFHCTNNVQSIKVLIQGQKICNFDVVTTNTYINQSVHHQINKIVQWLLNYHSVFRVIPNWICIGFTRWKQIIYAIHNNSAIHDIFLHFNSARKVCLFQRRLYIVSTKNQSAGASSAKIQIDSNTCIWLYPPPLVHQMLYVSKREIRVKSVYLPSRVDLDFKEENISMDTPKIWYIYYTSLVRT